MKKDFNTWNKQKIRTDSIKKRYFFREREIWWIALGENNPYYRILTSEDGVRGSAIISQIRSFDAKRLIKKIGTVSKEEYGLIQKSVMDLCGPITDFPDSALSDEPRPKSL
jgi:hypothetical protein